jgi:hypothetical protein
MSRHRLAQLVAPVALLLSLLLISCGQQPATPASAPKAT